MPWKMPTIKQMIINEINAFNNHPIRGLIQKHFDLYQKGQKYINSLDDNEAIQALRDYSKKDFLWSKIENEEVRLNRVKKRNAFP